MQTALAIAAHAAAAAQWHLVTVASANDQPADVVAALVANARHGSESALYLDGEMANADMDQLEAACIDAEAEHAHAIHIAAIQR
jgi:hypothetical protein